MCSAELALKLFRVIFMLSSDQKAAEQKMLPSLPHGYRFRHGTPSEVRDFYRESAELFRYLLAILGALFGVVLPAFMLGRQWARSLNDIAFVGLFSDGFSLVAALVIWLPFAISIFVPAGIVLHFVYTYRRRSRLSKQGLIWIAERNHQFAGIALISPVSPKRSELSIDLFFVYPAHRNRGVGSQLLWQLLSDPRIQKHHARGLYPLIKVVCPSYLKGFYQRFGFKSSDIKSTRHARKVPLYLATKPSFKGSQLGREGSAWSPDSLIRPVRSYRERWALYKLFWTRKRFKQSVWLLLSVSLISVFGCCLLSSFLGWLVAPVAAKITHDSVLSGLQEAIGSNLKFALFVIPLTLVSTISFAQTTLLNLFFFKITVGSLALWIVLLTIIIPRNLRWWRDWVIVHNHKAVGYLHVERHLDYSILHCLHVEPAYFRHLFHAKALAHIQQGIGFPVYVACLSESAHLYKKLGFKSVENLRSLPISVKILSCFRTRLLAITAADLLTLSKAVTDISD